MTRPNLYERIALARDFKEHGLKRGDIATLVDVVPHPSGGAEGLVLEISNALGRSLHTIVATAEDVEPLRENEVLAVRQLA
ncbi:MAG: DUF4926 domain-containing protein [Planctomycetota bacterium]|nr:MAG: DUF4926 domain-containing protein [Planctomycetota bacterium]